MVAALKSHFLRHRIVVDRDVDRHRLAPGQLCCGVRHGPISVSPLSTIAVSNALKAMTAIPGAQQPFNAASEYELFAGRQRAFGLEVGTATNAAPSEPQSSRATTASRLISRSDRPAGTRCSSETTPAVGIAVRAEHVGMGEEAGAAEDFVLVPGISRSACTPWNRLSRSSDHRRSAVWRRASSRRRGADLELGPRPECASSWCRPACKRLGGDVIDGGPRS